MTFRPEGTTDIVRLFSSVLSGLEHFVRFTGDGVPG